TVIGEGGSGGALAIAVADTLLMLQYATYSVISPEGCASILWKSAERAPEAAEALGLTAHRLKALGLIDRIVSEPVGGAHRDPKQMSALLKRALADSLRQFQGVKVKDLLAARHARLMGYGKFKETSADSRSAGALAVGRGEVGGRRCTLGQSPCGPRIAHPCPGRCA